MWRALALVCLGAALAAKKLIKAFYGQAEKYS